MRINGRVYAFEDASISLFGGKRQLDVTSIEYSDEVQKEHQFALGGIEPRGIGRGGYKAQGSLKLLREGFREMLADLRARQADVYGVQFNATVTYGDEDEDLMTDELPLCEFTNLKTAIAQGETKSEVELQFIVVQPIVWNGVPAVS